MERKIILLLSISLGAIVSLADDSYELASFQLSGWVDEDGSITSDGRVIVNEILSYIGRII